ncbi:MAG: hypothetical protein MJA27_33330 [Pseudanabaenales cyanobacterium]|nr:hypothetical protein [Pseudanabaenales cyanobacterium]
MDLENLEVAKVEYAYGQAAFERGNYRQSIQHLEAAVELASQITPLGGEIQIWLVTAYTAADRQDEAIALCEKLSRHPDLEIRKQSCQLLYILRAPKLKTRPEWLTQIPDLGSITADNDKAFKGGGRYAQTHQRKFQQPPNSESELIDLNQVNTQDNHFIWIALIGTGLIIGSLVWLG